MTDARRLLRERIAKHGGGSHDQLSHGNWAEGPREVTVDGITLRHGQVLENIQVQAHLYDPRKRTGVWRAGPVPIMVTIGYESYNDERVKGFVNKYRPDDGPVATNAEDSDLRFLYGTVEGTRVYFLWPAHMTRHEPMLYALFERFPTLVIADKNGELLLHKGRMADISKAEFIVRWVEKHADHDQSSHGNWADGREELPYDPKEHDRYLRHLRQLPDKEYMRFMRADSQAQRRMIRDYVQELRTLPEDWGHLETRVSPEAKAAFMETGNAQRGEPEFYMGEYQGALYGGVLSLLVEHMGDLSHRLSEVSEYGANSYETTMEKVERGLRVLGHGYGFRKEHEENLRNNYNYAREPGNAARYPELQTITFDQYHQQVVDMGRHYAELHRAVPVFNEAQWLGRQVAIEMGEWKFEQAYETLKKLYGLIGTPTRFAQEATKYTPGGWAPVRKHGDHDQKSHGNWAEGGKYVGPVPEQLTYELMPGLMDMTVRDSKGNVIEGESYRAFNSQAQQYPKKGSPGISYFKGVIDKKTHVDCLLYRDEEGKLIGILNYFPKNIGVEKKGNFTVIVDNDHRRQGIATKLVREAGRRWNIDLSTQTYSASGALLAHKLITGRAGNLKKGAAPTARDMVVLCGAQGSPEPSFLSCYGVRITKHGEGTHDEKSHGNWADGGAAIERIEAGRRTEEYETKAGQKRTREVIDFRYVGPDGKDITDPEALSKLRAMGVPPGVKNVRINPDPTGRIQAVWVDKKGREAALYSKEHTLQAARDKFARLREFAEKMPEVQKEIVARIDHPDATTRLASRVLYVIMATGFRIGGTSETGGDEKAYGASTLLNKHVRVDGDKVIFAFDGKHGVDIRKTVTDPELARIVSEHKTSNWSHRLFDVSPGAVRDVFKEIAGDDFKVKDLRTFRGTALALREIAKRQGPRDEKVFAKWQREVATKVARELGNTPAVALSSYIDFHVWDKWRKPEWGSWLPKKLAKGEEMTDEELIAALIESVLYDEPLDDWRGMQDPDPDDDEEVEKHADHDQSSHGNWARGGGEDDWESESRPAHYTLSKLDLGQIVWQKEHKRDAAIEDSLFGKKYASRAAALRAARERVLTVTTAARERGDWEREHLVMVGARGAILHETEGSDNEVRPHLDVLNKLESGEVMGATLVHSHPAGEGRQEVRDVELAGHPLSVQDILSTMSTVGIRAVEAVGHDGTVFRAVKHTTDEARAVREEMSHYPAVLEKIADVFPREAVGPMVTNRYLPDAGEAWRAHQYVAGKLLGKILGYDYVVENPSAQWRDFMGHVNKAVLAQATLQGLPDIKTIDDVAEAVWEAGVRPDMMRPDSGMPPTLRTKLEALWATQK